MIDDAVMFYDYKKNSTKSPDKADRSRRGYDVYTAAIVHKGNAELLNAANKVL